MTDSPSAAAWNRGGEVLKGQSCQQMNAVLLCALCGLLLIPNGRPQKRKEGEENRGV